MSRYRDRSPIDLDAPFPLEPTPARKEVKIKVLHEVSCNCQECLISAQRYIDYLKQRQLDNWWKE